MSGWWVPGEAGETESHPQSQQWGADSESHWARSVWVKVSSIHVPSGTESITDVRAHSPRLRTWTALGSVPAV